ACSGMWKPCQFARMPDGRRSDGKSSDALAAAGVHNVQAGRQAVLYFNPEGHSMNSEVATKWNTEALPIKNNSKSELPEIIGVDQFLSQSLPMPAELVKGMIHRSTLN